MTGSVRSDDRGQFYLALLLLGAAFVLIGLFFAAMSALDKKYLDALLLPMPGIAMIAVALVGRRRYP